MKIYYKIKWMIPIFLNILLFGAFSLAYTKTFNLPESNSLAAFGLVAKIFIAILIYEIILGIYVACKFSNITLNRISSFISLYIGLILVIWAINYPEFYDMYTYSSFIDYDYILSLFILDLALCLPYLIFYGLTTFIRNKLSDENDYNKA